MILLHIDHTVLNSFRLMVATDINPTINLILVTDNIPTSTMPAIT